MNIHDYISCNDFEQPLDRIVTDGGMCAVFRSICCIGDSLASGEFEAVGDDGNKSYHDTFDYSWGQFIARATGAKVLNFSRGGMTAKEYCDQFAEANGFWSSELLCQAYIIALGVNDILNMNMPLGSTSDVVLDDYSKNAQTFAGYYAKIIQRIKAMNPKAKFFLVTMPKDENADADVKKSAHAQLMYDFSGTFDNTYVLDLFKYAPKMTADYINKFCMGGHMSPIGYLISARMIESYIDYIIRKNPQDFKEIAFISTDLSFENKVSIDQKFDLESYYENVKSIHPIVRHIPEFDPICDLDLKAVTVDGVEINDKKTKFFAYMGFPEGADESTPGIVLIHGGGGHAFAHWAKIWIERGYSVIVPDTVGHFPSEIEDARTFCENDKWIHGPYGIFAEDGYAPLPNNDDVISSANKPVDERWLTHIVAQCMLSYTALIDTKKASRTKTGISGISWGGVAVSLAIGYDDRFAFAIPIYGSGYLDEAHSWMKDKFAHPQTRRYFLAQDRFDKVKMPVMWLCWNDDCCFSINCNSKSYLATMNNNEKTVLSTVHLMYHSHESGWQRCESLAFADSIVKDSKPLQRFTSFPDGASCDCTYEYDGKITSKVYYITEEYRYSSHTKHGMSNTFLDAQWQHSDLKAENGKITGSLPNEATYYYVEAVNENDVTVTTPLLLKAEEK